MVMTIFKIARDSSLPLHLQLLDELRHKIKSGELEPETQLPSEWELVEQLGISRATIQRAWQSAQDEGLIYRVAGKGTFVASPEPDADQRSAIGFFIPEYRGTFAVEMLRGAERVLREHGYHVQFASTDRNIEEENRLLQKLMNDGVNGCIIVPTRGPASGRLLASDKLKVPIVLMDRPVNGLLLPCVTSNNYVGGLQAMNHLVDLGHREIIFVARPHLDLWPVSERYRAYKDVMFRSGATPQDPFLIGDDHELSSYEAYLQEDDEEIIPLVELLQSPKCPTAIFAVNDWMALRVQWAITLAGLRNPEDVSVVGFDDLDIAQYQQPPLTTVAQNTSLIGAEAARRMITLVKGEQHENILTLVPTQLIIRSSTAPPP